MEKTSWDDLEAGSSEDDSEIDKSLKAKIAKAFEDGKREGREEAEEKEKQLREYERMDPRERPSVGKFKHGEVPESCCLTHNIQERVVWMEGQRMSEDAERERLRKRGTYDAIYEIAGGDELRDLIMENGGVSVLSANEDKIMERAVREAKDIEDNGLEFCIPCPSVGSETDEQKKNREKQIRDGLRKLLLVIKLSLLDRTDFSGETLEKIASTKAEDFEIPLEIADRDLLVTRINDQLVSEGLLFEAGGDIRARLHDGDFYSERNLRDNFHDCMFSKIAPQSQRRLGSLDDFLKR